MEVSARSRVDLPSYIPDDFDVFISGVRQDRGFDYEVVGRTLVFPRPIAQEGKLGFWRWFMGAWGIGTYRKDDQVDVSYELDGRPIVAHALDIEAPENDKS